MAQFTRRAFTAMMAGAPLAAAAQEPLPHRRLGRINFQTSILGFGAQHLGDNGVEQSLVDRTMAEAIDSGVNYVDTAPTYEASEIRVGYALKGKRDKVFLVSKVEILSRPDVLYQVKESLRKLQTDHLDCVHLHNVGRMERWPDMEFVLKHEEGALAGLIEAKKQGLIGHIGCSTHMRVTRVLPAFAIDHIELFMCPINFVDRHIYNFEEKVLPRGKGAAGGAEEQHRHHRHEGARRPGQTRQRADFGRQGLPDGDAVCLGRARSCGSQSGHAEPR
jgi:aryl-alcohol dehydrogenase-like predicted oxidoreductase